MFSTNKDYFKITSEYFTKFPRTAEDIQETLKKIKAVLAAEEKNSKEMWSVYNRAARGEATMNEITQANKRAQELLTATRFAWILAVPGTILILPLLIEFAQEHGVDLVPASVKKEFNL